MIRSFAARAVGVASAFAGACAGQPAASGIGEPIQVVGGQFIAGDLPSGPSGPAITSAQFNSQVVIPGAAGKGVSGRTAGSATAVGVRFADLGTGYWVVPVAEPDSQSPGELSFRFSASFDANDPAGFHPLRFVGIDASGRGGSPTDVPLCIADRVPDNLHACQPKNAPPTAVISLRWDTSFDLDLHVMAPGGIDINPKEPFGFRPEAGATPDARAPHIDRDSLGSCVADGLRQEDLVFQDPPPAGAYEVRVDPFASCGQSAVRFELVVYRRTGTCPACSLAPVLTQAGEVLSSQVTGGGSAGGSAALFVAQVSF